MSNERTCGDCVACCDGTLKGETFGLEIDAEKGCYFLNKLGIKGCSIYNDRPKMCVTYQCAYLKNLLPEFGKPNECGLLVDIRRNRVRIFVMRLDFDKRVFNAAIKLAKDNNLEVVKKITIKKV